MRFIERFLIVLVLIALVIRLLHSKDGPLLELIAMPLMAAYYIISSPILMNKADNTALPGKRTWYGILLSILYGLGIGYCLISLMIFTLGWLPRQDMLENCLLILVPTVIILYMSNRKARNPGKLEYLMRTAVLGGVILLASFLKW